MKKTYNHTLFSKYKIYKISKIAEKLGYSERTISGNWKKEGLKVNIGKVEGKDLIDFLKLKKQKRKRTKTLDNEFYCFVAKENIRIKPEALVEIDYIEKVQRFKARIKECKTACTKTDCPKQVRELSKIISINTALSLQQSTGSFTSKAQEKINTAIGEK